VLVSGSGIKIVEETELICRGNYEVVRKLNARLGEKWTVITIGPAGERKMSAAAVAWARCSAPRGSNTSIEATDAPVAIAKPEELLKAGRRGGRPKHNCHPGCVINCSQLYNEKDKKYLTSGLEYESIWAMGADCCVGVGNGVGSLSLTFF